MNRLLDTLRKCVLNVLAESNVMGINLKGSPTKFPPYMLTWDEYQSILNKEGYIYDNPQLLKKKYDAKRTFECIENSDCKLIRQRKVKDKLLKFYYELPKDDTLAIYCVDDGVIVGEMFEARTGAATIVSVVDTHQGYGIGEELIKLFRKYLPYVQSGGYTPSGFKQAAKYYNYMIDFALSKGVYSRMIRRGVVTKDKVKQILKNRPPFKFKKKPMFSNESFKKQFLKYLFYG